jgi:hypothetical protein
MSILKADCWDSLLHYLASAIFIHQRRINSIYKKMSFEPKQKVELDPPKDDLISQEYLAKCDGPYSIFSVF